MLETPIGAGLSDYPLCRPAPVVDGGRHGPQIKHPRWISRCLSVRSVSYDQIARGQRRQAKLTFAKFELNGVMRFLLYHDRACRHALAVRHIPHPYFDEIGRSQLAVDGEVE